MILFRIFRFLVVKNPYGLRSQIRFWILQKKTQPKSGFYQVKLAEESTWLTTYVQHTFLQV